MSPWNQSGRKGEGVWRKWFGKEPWVHVSPSCFPWHWNMPQMRWPSGDPYGENCRRSSSPHSRPGRGNPTNARRLQTRFSSHYLSARLSSPLQDLKYPISYILFGPVTIRNSDLSDQWTFAPVNRHRTFYILFVFSFWGLCPKPLPGLWTPLDFHPQTSFLSLPLAANSWLRPWLKLTQWKHDLEKCYLSRRGICTYVHSGYTAASSLFNIIISTTHFVSW